MILYSAADVIMGCGHPDYNNDGERVAPGKENYQYVGGRETWEAISRRGMTPVSPWTLVQTRKEFQDLIQGPPPKRVLGVAQSRDATQERRRGDPKAEPGQVPFIESVPTLKEMSVGALNVLNQNPKGFFLMIEGGAVDWAAHSNLSGRMIEEQMDFNLAADAVVEWVERNGGWDDALVIVTADHETGWLWGPGSGPNTDPMWKPLVNNGAGRMPGMQWCSTGHTNTLVPLYAKGAGADLFAAHVLPAPDPVRGAYVDNTSIALAIMQAMPPH
jgi:alkaline phosphatase